MQSSTSGSIRLKWRKYHEQWLKYLPKVSKDCKCGASGIIFSDDMKSGVQCNTCVPRAKALFLYEKSGIPDRYRVKDDSPLDKSLLDRHAMILMSSNPIKVNKYAVKLLKEHCKRGREILYMDISVILQKLKDKEYIETDVLYIQDMDRYKLVDSFLQPSLDNLIQSMIHNNGYVIIGASNPEMGYCLPYTNGSFTIESI